LSVPYAKLKSIKVAMLDTLILTLYLQQNLEDGNANAASKLNLRK
jgi:hypothetical protein